MVEVRQGRKAASLGDVGHGLVAVAQAQARQRFGSTLDALDRDLSQLKRRGTKLLQSRNWCDKVSDTVAELAYRCATALRGQGRTGPERQEMATVAASMADIPQARRQVSNVRCAAVRGTGAG